MASAPTETEERIMLKKAARVICICLLVCLLFSAQAEKYGDLEIDPLDETWQGEYLYGIDAVNLYKAKHYVAGDPTIRVFIDNLGIEDSILAAKAFFDGAGDDSDFTVQAGDFTLYGYRETVKNTVIDKLFYAIDSKRTLRFNLFVQNKGVSGLTRDDPEVLAIIEGTIRANGFDGVPEEPPAEIAPEDRHVLTSGGAAGLEMYSAADFSAPVPEGWNVQESTWGSQLLLIRGDGEYGSAPSVQIVYSDSKNTATVRAEAMKYCDEYRDIGVLIDGEAFPALEATSRMASKPVYWTYDQLFIPVEPSGCIKISVSVASSEFEGVALEDPDVQAIITGIHLP